MKERKCKIQDDFRKRLGLLVDVPKPGFGSSNDGNTARRFFKNNKVSSEITGINEDLIIRFYVILQCLSSGHKLDFKKFDIFCWKTAEMYVDLYPWYYMPPSVHKILCHGSSIAASFILPIGQLSEEAQEARNKDIKHFRENHTRKTSRVDLNSDIFHRLLLSSDPLISSTREVKTKKRKLHQSVKNLLIIDDSETESELEEHSCSSESE